LLKEDSVLDDLPYKKFQARRRMPRLRKAVRRASAILNPVSAILGRSAELVGYDPFRAIPVLMYHKIVDAGPQVTELNYFVSREAFERQMLHLARNNYTALSIEQYAHYLRLGIDWPSKSVLITFDDGYSGIASIAYPILKNCGFKAVVFLPYNYIGRNTPFPWETSGITRHHPLYQQLRPLSWTEVNEIKDVVSIGSHSVSHFLLAKADPDVIRHEIAESKRLIENRIGEEVISFSYPGGIPEHGAMNDITRKALQDAGYRVAFYSEIGRNAANSDPYLQRRIVVADNDSDGLFRAKLTGAFDWMRPFQQCFHKLF
jgi:peptidoglycan/xylan/chitin deacetylase (PgdA/CDA1 family)